MNPVDAKYLASPFNQRGIEGDLGFDFDFFNYPIRQVICAISK